MGGAMAGTKIASVVRINAIGDGAEAALLCEQFHSIEQLVLAVVAAISIVCPVRRIFELTRFDELVPETQRADEIAGLLAIVLRKACGKRCYREGAFTQSRMRCPSEISRVRSPRERNQQGIERAERSK